MLKFSNTKSTLEELEFQNDLILHCAKMQQERNDKDRFAFLPEPIKVAKKEKRLTSS